MKKRLLGLFLSALLLASALAVPASAARIPFRDVPEDHYAYYDIVYVYEKGLMDGTSDTTFSPDTPFSRAMFVTMLGRMEGIDLTRYTGAPFRDVPAGNWAAPYVQWAAENGIVNGTSEGRFSPSVTITNEQFATIVCRYMDATGRDFPSVPNWQPEISDFEAVSLWARPAVINLARYGVMDLSPDWQFFPRCDMDRVDIARYFTRLDALLSDGLLSAVDDPATRSEQTGETILSSLRAAGAYTWNWFVINAYTDPTDTVTAFYQPYNTDLTYERVLHPYVSSIQELTELGYRFYVSD
ncbi:MAG: S-layer homology domain-containing protein [Oscillospiraceae bacterium]|nr:S-layer homology domain-containing protein [Oscillospiraceae bacterium]